MKKAIFFDKDGTLIPDIPYNTDIEKITLSEGAEFAIRELGSIGFLFFVVSNQAGVAHGYLSEDDLLRIQGKLNALFKGFGEKLSGFYYCPHDPLGIIQPYNIECDCRKPQPGLLNRAAKEHSLDLTNSWMIGDILNDIEAGNRSGCRTILLDNGNETEWLKGEFRTPGFTATHLDEAARIITSAYLKEKQVKV